MRLFGFFGRSKGVADAAKLVKQAIDLSDKGEHYGAIRVLDRAITADSGNAQAHFERGMALMELDRAPGARKAFDQALAIQPDFPAARDWRARAAAALGDHRGAADDRWKDLQAHPEGTPGMGVSPWITLRKD